MLILVEQNLEFLEFIDSFGGWCGWPPVANFTLVDTVTFFHFVSLAQRFTQKLTWLLDFKCGC